MIIDEISGACVPSLRYNDSAVIKRWNIHFSLGHNVTSLSLSACSETFTTFCFMNVLGSYKTTSTRLTMVYLCQISKEHWQTTSNAEFAKFSILNQVNLKTMKTVKLNYSQNTGPPLQVHGWASSAVCQSLVIHQVSIMVYMYHKTHYQSHQL